MLPTQALILLPVRFREESYMAESSAQNEEPRNLKEVFVCEAREKLDIGNGK